MLVASDTPGTVAVVIAILSGVLGAIVGAGAAIVINERRMRFDREERLKDRQLLAADDFGTSLLKAINAADRMSHLMTGISFGGAEKPHVDPSARGDTVGALAEVRDRRARIDMLFSEKSPVVEKGVDAINAVQAVVDALNAYDEEAASKSLAEARTRRTEFNELVLKSLRESS